MLDDAYRNLADTLVFVSGDSDLVPPIRMIRNRLPDKRLIVHVPAQHPTRGHAVELRASAHINRNLPLNLLKFGQFVNPLPDGNGGVLNKSASW